MTQSTPSSDQAARDFNGPHSDPLDILLIHNRWANENILRAFASLSHEQFHQEFDMGPGSLHDTMTHVLGAMRGWTDMLRGEMLPGKTPRPRIEEGGERSADSLVALLETVSDELEHELRQGSLSDHISGERGGNTYAFTRGGIATHVTTHGMHHRAQCLNMLRSLNVDPLPPSAVLEWMLMVDPISK